MNQLNDNDGKEGTNPKDLLGVKKLPFHVVPPAGLIHEARVMQYGAYEAKRADGGHGYGPMNWRKTKVKYTIYLDAIWRHYMAVLDGQDLAPDSLCHHIAHIKADCGIILDALENGVLIDDRPPKGNASEIIERFNK